MRLSPDWPRGSRVSLWPEAPPSSTETEADPDVPTLDIYLPPGPASGTGVVVFPGGGYGNLSMDHEGGQTAAFLNSHGIAAFVVRYRHAPRHPHPAPLDDALGAVGWVRSRAASLGLSPDRLGVMGFSAGGHLASTVLLRGKAGDAARPDFGVLIYPVITFTREPHVHKGSRNNLLGGAPARWEELSSERHVGPHLPPVFLVHGGEDTLVTPENSLLFYQACREAGVPAELHLTQQGDHGLFSPSVHGWKKWLADWMGRNGWIA